MVIRRHLDIWLVDIILAARPGMRAGVETSLKAGTCVVGGKISEMHAGVLVDLRRKKNQNLTWHGSWNECWHDIWNWRWHEWWCGMSGGMGSVVVWYVW